MYVTDNYDIIIVVALEFFLACMCMVLLPRVFMYGLLYACSVL